MSDEERLMYINTLTQKQFNRIRDDYGLLAAEEVYEITDDDTWGYSPDGEGMIWYDTLEALIVEHF